MPQRMLKNFAQQGRSKRRGEGYSVRCVKPLSEVRTSPGERRVSARRGGAGEKSDIFSILLHLLHVE